MTKIVTEIHEETRARIFASYSPENFILKYEEFPRRFNYIDVFTGRINRSEHDINNCSLLLTSLADITDEDAIVVAKIAGQTAGDPIYWGKELIINHLNKRSNVWGQDWIRIFDYLRSRHYALPFAGYSVEQLIECGVFTLKR